MRMRMSGSFRDQLLFLSTSLSFFVISHLTRMTHAVQLKSALISTLKQTWPIVAAVRNTRGSQSVHLSVVVLY